jgi:hypothetical protein
LQKKPTNSVTICGQVEVLYDLVLFKKFRYDISYDIFQTLPSSNHRQWIELLRNRYKRPIEPIGSIVQQGNPISLIVAASLILSNIPLVAATASIPRITPIKAIIGHSKTPELTMLFLAFSPLAALDTMSFQQNQIGMMVTA